MPTSVVAIAHTTCMLYKATYQIGHEANSEGITCAFCHSIETPRLMGLGNDGDIYTLAKHLRVGAHGPVKAAAGSSLAYNVDATDSDMNKFFRLVGPEKYKDYSNTPKNVADFDMNKSKDGRYTMTSVDINGTNGKTHHTGGPFYGPFGPSGKSNENADDDTNRTALLNPHYDKDTNNHFSGQAKSLCLSCHQRSAGAAIPTGEPGAGQFMELCSTQVAVTTGDDTPTNDSLSSPKCQKCHMERIEGNLLHKWVQPHKSFVAAEFLADVGYKLTPELDEKDTTVSAGNNPQRDGWYNSHAFLGAHPMRRTLNRLIVTDSNGTKLNVISSTGMSTFGNIENNVQTLQGKILHKTATAAIPVHDNGSADLAFPGKTPDMNG